VRPDAGAFTLIELLVVVSIVALLLAVLLPSLQTAREQGKMAVCASNLRQAGTAIHAYANEQRGYIPRGPEPAHPFDFAANTLATNQLWIGAGGGGPPPAHPQEYNGLGSLLNTILTDARALFCPADDNFNLQEEAPKVGTSHDAYGSYLYRQLDHLPVNAAQGKLDRLGENDVDGQLVPVEALALDANSLGPGDFHHTNHRGRRVNVMFRDGSVNGFENRADAFAISAKVFFDFAGLPTAIDQILTNADYAYRGAPANAPKITIGR
jgi:prepilin-type N-terminal cleavage/methylation domain-containing protein